MQQLQQLAPDSLIPAVEALLLVSTEAVSAATLAQSLGAAPQEIEDILASLAEEYRTTNRGFQLREISGGWRLFTHPAYHEQVEGYILSWDKHTLSEAALETLAIIAYHQPVTREGVRQIRGVSSDGVINSLKQKGLVREMGKDERQAALFGTTRAFLEHFGLRSLKDLPPLEDFAPDEQSKQFIRERLSGTRIESTLEEAAEDIEEEQSLLGAFDSDAEQGFFQELAVPGQKNIDADEGRA
ncbi:MAG: SMC-Scp complex subunit ScpB [Atopobiaceae bacterium]